MIISFIIQAALFKIYSSNTLYLIIQIILHSNFKGFTLFSNQIILVFMRTVLDFIIVNLRKCYNKCDENVLNVSISFLHLNEKYCGELLLLDTFRDIISKMVFK